MNKVTYLNAWKLGALDEQENRLNEETFFLKTFAKRGIEYRLEEINRELTAIKIQKLELMMYVDYDQDKLEKEIDKETKRLKKLTKAVERRQSRAKALQDCLQKIRNFFKVFKL